MNGQSFDILQEEGFRLMPAQDILYFKEQRTSRFVLETESAACQ